MRFILASLLVLLQVAWAAPAWANPDPSKEYLVKAAFIYNFVKFVGWPESAFSSQPHTLNICIMGANPFENAIKAIEKQSTPTLQLKVVTDVDASSMRKCQMLYVSDSEKGHYRAILSQAEKLPILTVSDIDGFAGAGGMVGFVMVDNKVKLEVNVGAARQSGLRIDGMLLEVAVNVIGN